MRVPLHNNSWAWTTCEPFVHVRLSCQPAVENQVKYTLCFLGRKVEHFFERRQSAPNHHKTRNASSYSSIRITCSNLQHHIRFDAGGTCNSNSKLAKRQSPARMAMRNVVHASSVQLLGFARAPTLARQVASLHRSPAFQGSNHGVPQCRPTGRAQLGLAALAPAPVLPLAAAAAAPLP